MPSIYISPAARGRTGHTEGVGPGPLGLPGETACAPPKRASLPSLFPTSGHGSLASHPCRAHAGLLGQATQQSRLSHGPQPGGLPGHWGCPGVALWYPGPSEHAALTPDPGWGYRTGRQLGRRLGAPQGPGAAAQASSWAGRHHPPHSVPRTTAGPGPGGPWDSSLLQEAPTLLLRPGVACSWLEPGLGAQQVRGCQHQPGPGLVRLREARSMGADVIQELATPARAFIVAALSAGQGRLRVARAG